jgi:hypothetical protein
MSACQNCGHPASHHEEAACWTKGDGKECADWADMACFCPEYMLSKTMAEVIREELRKGSYQMPGDTLPYETQANAIAAHLTAAGFGLVADAFEEGVFACVTAVATDVAPINPYRATG